MTRVPRPLLVMARTTFGSGRRRLGISNSNNNGFDGSAVGHRSFLSTSFPATTTTTTSTNVFSSRTATITRRVHSSNNNNKRADDSNRLVIVGSGVAGSAAALIAAETYQIPVTMIYAGQLPTDCNSYWAQGGIIYRNYDPKSNDSAELLAEDIHRAGAGLCNPLAVQKVAQEGPERVRQLLLDTSHLFAHVPFDRTATGDLALCLEASHAAPRILHKADHTGRVITQHITEAAARHPLIQQIPHTVVTDLVVTTDPYYYHHNNNNSSKDDDDSQAPLSSRVKQHQPRQPPPQYCVGVETLDRATGRRGRLYGGRGTVLASGGLAGIFEHTTNPAGFNALGSSVALASRQGVTCKDLEYVQFHPTALYVPPTTTTTRTATTATTAGSSCSSNASNSRLFLLSEALRGEGAILRDGNGRAFARDYHPDGELAPRDVVARAVFAESHKKNLQHHHHNVFLDITHRDGTWLKSRFPSIHKHLLQDHGFDLSRDLLPIVPAAHYTCGGIATDLHGRTSLLGLYAAGEAACTGLHGGNRLASTSLLEGLVFGASVADYVGSNGSGSSSSSHNCQGLNTELQEAAAATEATLPRQSPHFWRKEPFHHDYYVEQQEVAYRAMELLQSVRRIMWDHVGVVRTIPGLQLAISKLQSIQMDVEQLHTTHGPTLETSAVRDATHAGLAVATAAQENRRSIGAHCLMTTSVVVDEQIVDEEEEEEETSANAAEV